MNKIALALVAGLAGVLLSQHAFAQDLARGEERFARCAACHGAEGTGNPQLQAPPIAGLDQEYIVEQLQSFRQGTRGHPESPYGNQMRMIALTLEEDELEDVAAYVAELPPLAEPPAVDGDVGAGQREFLICSACHGDEGEGQLHLNSPRLAGLSDVYLLEQLLAYREGRRGYDPDDIFGVQMRTMALALRDDQAVRDVVAFVATLEGPEPPEPTIGTDAQQGEQTFALCAACHGESAQGDRRLATPALAGQHDWYLLRQLEAFRTGERGTHDEDFYGQQMRQIALTLQSREEMENVVAYIATMRAEPEEADPEPETDGETGPAEPQGEAGGS